MTRQRIRIVLGTVALAVAVALSGCGAEDSGSDGASVAEAPAGAPQRNAADLSGGGNKDAVEFGDRDDSRAGAPGAEPAPAQPGTGGGADLRVDQRSIIYTGSMAVRVEDVEKAAAEAVSIATAAGGFVGGDKRSSTDSTAEATIELRIPAAKFSGVVDSLSRLGKPLRRDVNTEDVTEAVVDLDARIATQQARVASGRRLLAQAKTLADLVMLEGEVAKREADLASLEAKKRRLADLTSLSTITVSLLGPQAKVVEEEDDEVGFLAGLRGGWKAFLASLEVFLTVLGALLPWLFFIGLPILGLVWGIRRMGRRNQPVGVPALAPAGPLPAQPGFVPAHTVPAHTVPAQAGSAHTVPAQAGSVPARTAPVPSAPAQAGPRDTDPDASEGPEGSPPGDRAAERD